MIPNKLDHLATKILNSLGIVKPVLLGKGAQSWVFEYKENFVVKVHLKDNQKYLNSLMELEKTISTYNLPYETPEIFEIGSKDNIFYTLERRLSGKTLGSIFANLNKSEKEGAVREYLNALRYLNRIILSGKQFGQVLITSEEVTSSSWAEFLDRKIEQRIGLVRKQLEKDVLKLDWKIDLMREGIKNKLTYHGKNLVHGDYFYNNVLFDDKLKLSAVFDFSNSTVVGDPRLDIACAVMFFDLDLGWKKYLVNLVIDEYSEEILPIIDFYTAYEAFFQAESFYYNESLYKWCLNHLNSEELWAKLK